MKLTTPPNKDYRQDIEIIREAIDSGEHITISKFCDGELAIIINQELDNKEFHFDPRNAADQLSRKLLIDAFQYKNPRYYVGITCTKVFGLDTHRKMKMISGQSEENLTWADIWVNSNYPYYIHNILPIFARRKTILICNENGKDNNLPFKPEKIYRITNSAFRNNIGLIDEIKSDMSNQNIRDHIFLFCCGPFGNILAHKLTEYSDDNTYLDIGSTLNPYLQSEGFKRDYYVGHNMFSTMTGGWDNSCQMLQ